MSIRLKIGLVLGVLIIGVVALNFVLATKFILPSFGKIEENNARVNVERVIEVYDNEFEYLGSKLADWANWNDTYDFIVDKNIEYIESNLTNVSVQNLKIDIMIFLDTKGEVVYQKGYDMDSNELITDFSGWAEHIKKGAVIADYEENKFERGLLMVAGRPVLFASRPILTSDASGPNRGTIIFAKYLDEVEIGKLAGLTRLELLINPVDKYNDQDDKAIIDSLIQTGDRVHIIKTDNNYLHGHSLIKDYYEKPQLFLEVKLKREIYNQGMSAVRYFVLFSTIAGLVLLVITSMLLERVVIKKIIKFNSNISEITKKNDFSQRIAVVGNDEFSNMSTNTNIMLEALEKASYKTETEHQKSQAYLKVMGTMLVALDLKGGIDFVNDRAMEILGIGASEEVTGKNWFENFIPEKDQEKVKEVFRETSRDDGKGDYHENAILDKDGNEKIIAWHNAVLRDGTGKIIGTVSSGDDITEKRKQEEKEKELVMELKRMNDLMVGRELKMVELKKEIKEFKNKLK